MSPSRKRPNSTGRRSWTWRLHLWSGLAAAVILLTIAVTGVLLNHTERLRLAQRHVSAEWVLALYGFPAPPVSVAATVNGATVAQVGEQIYLNDLRLQRHRALRGAAQLEDELLLAVFANELALYTHRGDLVDTMAAPQSSVVGNYHVDAGGRIYAETASGVVVTTTDFLAWQSAELPPDAAPLRLREPTEAEAQQYRRRYYRTALSAEQLLLDLHSGRLFGTAGVLLFDLAALVLVLQVVTGLILWRR